MKHFIYYYTECHYAECRNAECRGAHDLIFLEVFCFARKFFFTIYGHSKKVGLVQGTLIEGEGSVHLTSSLR